MQKYKVGLLIFIATILAYGASVKYGFSQDDFFFLGMAKANSLLDVLHFFSPWHQQGFPFFRPLGTQFYYYLFTHIARENAPYGMHLFMLALQALNGYLVYRLITRLTKNHTTSILVGVLYATSSAHFLSLFYIAATQQLLAATFSLISLNVFMRQRFWLAGLLLIPGLLSKESALVTPGVAVFLSLVQQQKIHPKKLMLHIVPYALALLLYLLLRGSAGIHIQSEYQPVFGPSLLSTIRWYLLFGYGAPEELLRYGLSGMTIHVSQFIHDFGYLGLISIITTFTVTIVAGWATLTSFVWRKPFSRLQITALLAWFLTGIFLIIWYPDHRYPHYLDLSLIPLLYLAIEGKKGISRYLLILLLLVASFSAIKISIARHWTTGRALMAEAATKQLDWGVICQHDALLFIGEGARPRELSYTLSQANGPRIICQKPDLKVYYQGVDITGQDDTYQVIVDSLFK